MKTTEVLEVTRPDLTDSLRRLSKLSDKEFPWNLVNLSHSDGYLHVACFSPIGHARAKLKSTGSIPQERLCEITTFVDALESFKDNRVKISLDEENVVLQGSGKRTIRVPTNFSHKFNIIPPRTSKCEDIEFSTDQPMARLEVMKLLGTKSPVEGVYISDGKMLITNNSATSFIYDSDCKMNPGSMNDQPVEVMIPRIFVPVAASLGTIESVEVGNGRVLFKTAREEVCMPLCPAETIQKYGNYAKRVKSIADLGSEDTIRIIPDMVSMRQEMDAAIRCTASIAVDPSIDLIITKDKMSLRIVNHDTGKTRFEAEVQCKTEGYKDTESSEFGINVRSIAGALKELSSSTDSVFRIYRNGPAIFHAIMGTSHMVVGMENSSAGVRRQV